MDGATMPQKYRDLFDKKAFAFLATLMSDGSPQVTPVWIGFDGTHLIVNTARGRVKDENMQRDPRVAVAVHDPDDPYRYMQVQGRVVEITEGGADEVIDELARKYLDVERYPHHSPDEVRVTYKILPEQISGKE
jgi:PPOX class probable F420-dependent enzyme